MRHVDVDQLDFGSNAAELRGRNVPDPGLSPSEQVAFMQREAEELARVLSMASMVASLLERCGDLEADPQPLVLDAARSHGRADPAAAGALSSIRSAAGGFQGTQRDVLRKLMQGTLMVTRHLSQAAALALRDLVGSEEISDFDTGQGDETHGENRGRVIRLRAEPADAYAQEALETDREAAAMEKRRPLEGWLRALARFCSSVRVENAGHADWSEASTGSGEAPPLATETRVSILGPTALSKVMDVYRGLGDLGGVQDVTIGSVSPGAAELTVRHGGVDLRAVAGVVPGARIGRAQPGSLTLHFG